MLTIPVHGTSNLTIPDAPKIAVNVHDARLAALPGLRVLVDPETLSATGGKDRVGGIVVGYSASMQKVEASNLNGRHALRIAAPDAFARLSAGSQRGSQTCVMVLRPTLVSGTSNRLISNGTMVLNRSGAANGFLISSANGAGTVATAPLAPEVGKSMVVGYSFDEATGENYVFGIKQGMTEVVSGAATMTTFRTDAEARGLMAEVGSVGSALQGDYGQVLFLDGALHKTNPSALAEAIAALRSYYAI